MKLLTILLVLFSVSAIAGKSQFLPFFDSLEDRFLMRTDHLIDLSEKIKLKKFGIFGNRNAEATYTPFTNTISLKDEYMVKVGRQYRIKKYQEFSSTNGYNLFAARATTIFHELAHADFDIFIEKDKNHPMHKLLMKDLPTWFKRHAGGVNSKTATHELFGYTAGDFIFMLEGKIQDILIAHGVYHNENKCFPRGALDKIALRLNLTKNDLSFRDIFSSVDFKEMIIPKVIFINGKSVDVKLLPDRFQRKILNYFSDEFDMSLDSKNLTSKLNSSHFFIRLENCYSFLK
jgi:hypothetical protein